MPPRMRTIKEAAAELREIDPNTAVTPYCIRRLVLEGAIPHVKTGNKRLINFDKLLEYLSNPSKPESVIYGQIRPVKEGRA